MEDDQYKEMAEFIARVFKTEDGVRMLELLKVKFQHKVIADPKLTFEQATYNQGRADVVRWIELQIKKAEEVHK